MHSSAGRNNNLMRYLFAVLVLAVSGYAQSPMPVPEGARAAPNLPPKAGLTLAQFYAHDPWILPDPATHAYYLYNSLPLRAGLGRSGTLAYRSEDLKTWEGPFVVFTIPDGCWADPKEGAWAPEVHFYQGKYYLFTTLHNPSRVLGRPPETPRLNYMRGTVIAEADHPLGPFHLLKMDGPIAPSNFMTLDGTFYVDSAGKPWMVYAHEWVQKNDGTMEAVPLKPDLSGAAGPPIFLFKASDAPWIDSEMKPSPKENRYVTDGPEMYRTRTGRLLMLWSSYDDRGYVETLARSRSGEIQGPWEQLGILVGHDSGHGMPFHSFDGQFLLVLHQPFRAAHAKIYQIEDAGDTLRIVRYREDLSGGQAAH